VPTTTSQTTSLTHYKLTMTATYAELSVLYWRLRLIKVWY